MGELLFNPAWYYPVAGALLAAAAFVYFNNRQQERARTGAVVAAGAALLWMLAALLVSTPIEKAEARARALVAAVDEGDWDAFRVLLDPNTALPQLGWLGGEQITERARARADSVKLSDATVLGSTPRILPLGPTYEVDLNVATYQALPPMYQSQWRLTFLPNPTGGRLLLVEIRNLQAQESGVIEQIRR